MLLLAKYQTRLQELLDRLLYRAKQNNGGNTPHDNEGQGDTDYSPSERHNSSSAANSVSPTQSQAQSQLPAAQSPSRGTASPHGDRDLFNSYPVGRVDRSQYSIFEKTPEGETPSPSSSSDEEWLAKYDPASEEWTHWAYTRLIELSAELFDIMTEEYESCRFAFEGRVGIRERLTKWKTAKRQWGEKGG